MRRLTLCDVSGISQTLVVCVNIALGVLPHLVSPSLALQSSMLTPSNPLVMPSERWMTNPIHYRLISIR